MTSVSGLGRSVAARTLLSVASAGEVAQSTRDLRAHPFQRASVPKQWPARVEDTKSVCRFAGGAARLAADEAHFAPEASAEAVRMRTSASAEGSSWPSRRTNTSLSIHGSRSGSRSTAA
eukprot:TRINITY_DN22763_c0_g1_i1.p3 TRINITY_DN22763_c0_g1~~TRINITY_DN22763_c0_g1_i1.p3  ORF type:complete len:119 (-),score=9.05 TRINITY_DN22763_c0_g1_i1:86-442(-)